MKTFFDVVKSLFVTTTKTGESLTYGLEELSPEIVHQLALHGLKQKVGDAAAIPRNTETGASATEGEKLEAMRRVWESLQAGDWSIRAPAGEGGNDGLLVRALCRIYPKSSVESIREKVAGMDKAKQAALRVSPKVAPVIAEIKAEDDARKARGVRVDTDALLADFE